MTNPESLFAELTLPNGQKIKNRLCKAAMEENLSDRGQLPGERLLNLYQQWSEGGVGLILTGNVMVAPDALTGPGGVVLQDQSNLTAFCQWAESAQRNNTHCWMQINHPGRQVYAAMGETAYAPSEVPLDMGSFSSLFASPKALSEEQIQLIIGQFVTTAKLAEQAGFTGVQIHAAHGYLISQFLSPLTNKRDDSWGGTRDNRARFLFEIVKRVRGAVAKEFLRGSEAQFSRFSERRF